jgi:hypothetical protein
MILEVGFPASVLRFCWLVFYFLTSSDLNLQFDKVWGGDEFGEWDYCQKCRYCQIFSQSLVSLFWKPISIHPLLTLHSTTTSRLPPRCHNISKRRRANPCLLDVDECVPSVKFLVGYCPFYISVTRLIKCKFIHFHHIKLKSLFLALLGVYLRPSSPELQSLCTARTRTTKEPIRLPLKNRGRELWLYSFDFCWFLFSR